MIPNEFKTMYAILASFLGEAKGGFDGKNMQLQFSCPRCVEKYGRKEESKHNLEVNLEKQLFHCWKCKSEDENDMHGSIFKLIKLYGNEQLFDDYRKCLESIKDSKLYNLDFMKDFKIDLSEIEKVKFPEGFRYFKEGKYAPNKAMEYLQKRNIGWDIIKKHRLGFTNFNENNKIASNRIIIPSYNKFGELNYWTGRDFTDNPKRQRYFNPKVERKEMVFDEDKIQWNADITLVEGPFDHLVVPNSIPLLGKVIDENFKLYWELMSKANANINIFLDGDAFETVKATYKILNHGRLYNKIRYIPVGEEYDPSLLYQLGGAKTIGQHLANSQKINEVYLV